MNDIEKVIETLRSIYPSQKEIRTGEYDHVADALDDAISALEQQLHNGWIPVTWHETTDEDGIDKIKYPTTLDCRMPEDGEEILVCSKKSVWQDTCFNDDGYYLDSGNDWIDDVIAWRQLPQPYQP